MASTEHPETPLPATPGATPGGAHGSLDKSREPLAGRIAFLTGSFGVLSGFAIFFLMLEKADEPVLFLGVLALASVLSAIFEWVREQIEHPHAEEHSKEHGQRSLTRFFVFLVILAVAEVHVMSWEALTQISASHEFSAVIHSVLGSSITGSKGVYLDLAFLFGFWVLAGGVLASTLLSGLRDAEGPVRAQMLKGGTVGAFTGALVAPLCLFGYVLVIWVLRGLYLLLFQPAIWRANVQALHDHAATIHNWIGMAFSLVFSGMLKVTALLGDHPLGPIAAVVAAVILMALFVRWDADWAAIIILLALVAVVIAPLLINLGAVLVMLLRAALVWVVPGLVLGAMSPLLRETSEEKKPKSWALVAFASAAVLFLITALRFRQSWWLLLPAALFVAMGFALRRSTQAGPYWLPMAVCIGVLVWGAMLGVQSASSFAGVYDSMHRITSLPQEVAAARPPKSKAVLDFDAAMDRLHLQNRNPAWPTLSGGRSPQDARALAATLEALEKQLQSFELHPEKLHASIAALETRAEHLHEPGMKWFEHMTHLIGLQRDILDLAQDIEDTTRVPLQKLRAQVVAVPLPAVSLGELLPAPGKPFVLPPPGTTLADTVRRDRAALIDRIDARLAKLEHIRNEITAIGSPIADEVLSTRGTVIRWLELALAGSVGYWTAISLLVGWSLQRRKESPSPEPARPPPDPQ